jgi:hypothetical protein
VMRLEFHAQYHGCSSGAHPSRDYVAARFERIREANENHPGPSTSDSSTTRPRAARSAATSRSRR